MNGLLKYYGVDWVGMVFAFVSVHYLGKFKRWGFVIGIGGNVAWMVFGIMSESVANIVSNFIYIILNIKGWRNWKEQGNSAAVMKNVQECSQKEGEK